jgi:hypothetical protein
VVLGLLVLGEVLKRLNTHACCGFPPLCQSIEALASHPLWKPGQSHVNDHFAEFARDGEHFCLLVQVWDIWSRPYIDRIAKTVKEKHPEVPITIYVNNSGGLVERMAGTSTDVLGLDWSVDMADCRRRVGPDVTIQVKPCSLFPD